MSKISDEYTNIINELEKNITDENQLKYLKTVIEKISTLFINQMEQNEKMINKIVERQSEMDSKVEELAKTVNSIENELYIECENNNLNIICPYCNFEFSEEFDETKTNVQCPKCQNLIELDFGDEDCCSGSCSNCNGCENE